MRTNTVKRKLKEGKVCVGTWLSTASTLMAEAMAHQGFDWLVVDMEHAATDFETLQSMLMAISTTDTIPMCRVPWNDAAFIKRALDFGAFGLVIPLVMTREEAEEAVRWTRYPPMGYRGVGGTRRGLYFGSDYFDHSNEETLLLIQIEHIEAVERIDEILSVPGLDGVYVGPNDLSASLGLKPMMDNPDPRYEEVLKRIIDGTKRHGLVCGAHCGSAQAIQKYSSWGMQFFSLNTDVGLTMNAVQAEMAVLRGEDPAGGAKSGTSAY